MKSFGSVLGRARDGDESATAHGGIGAGFRSAAAAQTEKAARAFRAGAMQYNAALGADASEGQQLRTGLQHAVADPYSRPHGVAVQW
jgi:hypothetical protein